MNEVVIPLFKSHYSIGRSILTLEKPEDMIQNGPDSIIQIAKEHKLDQVFLIEDSMSGFLQAYKNLQEENIKLIFGLKITVCPDMSEKNADSLLKSCKYVIVCKNTDGYKRLIKIFSTASLRCSGCCIKKLSNCSSASLSLFSSFFKSLMFM